MEAWLTAGRHLPAALRDFHHKKGVFAAMHALQDACSAGPRDGLAKLLHVDQVAGHTYVIDRFLWFMARRGWTLQRSRADLPFCDLKADVDGVLKARREQFHAAVLGRSGSDHEAKGGERG
jgi:hypothetical protein